MASDWLAAVLLTNIGFLHENFLVTQAPGNGP